MAELEKNPQNKHVLSLLVGVCVFFGGKIEFISCVNSVKVVCHYVLTHTSFTEMTELETHTQKHVSLVLVGVCFSGEIEFIFCVSSKKVQK